MKACIGKNTSCKDVLPYHCKEIKLSRKNCPSVWGLSLSC